MRTIAVMNQKGGVGKTTSAVNLAAGLGRLKQSVLLIDVDPQAHATLHVGVEPGAAATLYDVLIHGASIAEASRTVAKRLALVPAHIDLAAAELEMADRAARERLLAQALRAFHEHFDFCVLDCPPSLGLLSLNALCAADEVVIPLQPHFLALHGLGRLLETVGLVRAELNPALRVSAVLLCMFEQGTRLGQEVRDDVTRFFDTREPPDPAYGARVLRTVIRRNIKLAECPSHGRSIFDYAPTSHGAEDYLSAARELAALGAPTPAATVLRSATADAGRVLPPQAEPASAAAALAPSAAPAS